MPASVLPIAEWLPDLPDFPAEGAQNIRNVYPRTKASYGPVGALTGISSPLVARCQGAAGFIDNLLTDRVELVAGDATILYRLHKENAYQWTDASSPVTQHTACVAATVAPLPFAPVYNNVNGSLIAGSNGALMVDGQAVGINDRLLIKDQPAEYENGIFDVIAAGSPGTPYHLVRSLDFDTVAAGEIEYRAFILISGGAVNTGTGWMMSTVESIMLGVTPLKWVLATNALIGGGPYHIKPDDMWEFEHFNSYIIASNIADPIQLSFLTVDFFESIDYVAGINWPSNPLPPKAKHICVVKNTFLVLGYTNDSMYGEKEQRIWWSGAGDLTSWPTPGSIQAAQVQSGFFDLLGDDGQIMAIRAGITAADGLVFQKFGIKRMVYTGPPTIFAFLPAQNARGTPAEHSPVVVGGNCYFLGYDGFYVTDGAACVPIGHDKVDKTFFADLDLNYVNRVVGAADPIAKMVWWAYPGSGAQDGSPNHLIGYQWELRRWVIVDVDCEIIARMIGLGYTLDELYTVLGYTLDTLPAPLDSSLWVGGSLQLGLFTLNHKLGYLLGPSLAPTVETSEIDPIAGRRLLVRGARVLVDGSAAKNPAVSIGHRERLQLPVTYTLPVTTNALGNCPVRASGRYVRAVTTIAAGGDWTNISGVELDVQPQGQR